MLWITDSYGFCFLSVYLYILLNFKYFNKDRNLTESRISFPLLLKTVFKFIEDILTHLLQTFVLYRSNSLKDPASKAYAQVFSPHHGWAIRKAVAAGMYALPTKAQLLSKLNEDGEFYAPAYHSVLLVSYSLRAYMRSTHASLDVCMFMHELYIHFLILSNSDSWFVSYHKLRKSLRWNSVRKYTRFWTDKPL